MKTALQIYSLRQTVIRQMEQDLTAIREIGYDGVELVNFSDPWLDKAVRFMKEIGLEVFSIHTGIDEMKSMSLDRLKQYADWGVKYIPLGYLPEERRPGAPLYEESKKIIRDFSEKCGQAGLRLIYHNHDFDFFKLKEQYCFDRLLQDLSKEVIGAELDTCWIYTAGADVLQEIRKYGPVCPILHLKDCVAAGGHNLGFRAIGEGVLNFKEIIAAAKEEDIPWLCVEQDEPSPGKTPMDCAKESFLALRDLL